MIDFPRPSDILSGIPGYDPKAHLRHVQTLYAQYELKTKEKADEWTFATMEVALGEENFPHKMLVPIRDFIDTLYTENDIYRFSPPTLMVRDYLDKLQHQLSEERRDTASGMVVSFLQELKKLLPGSVYNRDKLNGPKVPLHTFLPDLRDVVSAVIVLSTKKYVGEHLALPYLADQLGTNIHRLSGIMPGEQTKKRFLTPQTYKGDPLDFVRDTPFEALLSAQVPFQISRETQFAHTWVCAGSGHGKTTALTSMIFEHIPEVIAGSASVVLIDSQNVIIPALERLKVWQGTDRLIVIDPDDPVALSLFDVPRSSINSALEMINFVFAKLSDNELTYRQGNLFDYLGEFLITAVPDATIYDFRNMLDLRRAKEYEKFYPNASSEVQDYLDTDFVKEKFTVDARSQVLTKMRAMLRMPAFAKMFGSPRTKINLFKELERGTCILIKPSKYAMGDDGTRLFGRFWIAQMKIVAQQRQITTRKTPTYFYIDECQDYLRGGDPKIEAIFEQARKECIGLTLLHHYGDQLKSSDLLQLLGANTAVKMCGSLASSDLSRFSTYMQCDPEFLLKQQPRKTFAVFVRGLTSRAVSVGFPYVDLTKEPRLTEAEWRTMRDANRERYGIEQSMTAQTAKQRSDEALFRQFKSAIIDEAKDLQPQTQKAAPSDPPSDDDLDGITTPGKGGWRK